MMEKIGLEFDADTLTNAVELAKRGAKPRVIAALTRIKASHASKLYMKVHGRSPTPGQFADSFHRFVRTRSKHFQSSLLFNLFLEMRKLGLSDAQIILQADQVYRMRFADDPKAFDCNDIFALWVALKNPDLTVSVCTECDSRYFLPPLELAEHAETCPFCRLEKKILDSTAAVERAAMSA